MDFADHVCPSAPANRSLLWVEGDAYMATSESKDGTAQTQLRVIQREFDLQFCCHGKSRALPFSQTFPSMDAVRS